MKTKREAILEMDREEAYKRIEELETTIRAQAETTALKFRDAEEVDAQRYSSEMARRLLERQIEKLREENEGLRLAIRDSEQVLKKSKAKSKA